MGKTSWEQKGQWKGQEGGGSPSWAYWSGTWRANKWTRGNPSSAGSGQPEKDRAFPAYNQMPTSGIEVEGVGKDGDQASPQIHDPFIKSMQKFLNQSRKLDAKIRKAVSDRQDMGRQWAEFQQKLRESFVEQRQKYLADSSRMDQELAELQQQKKDSLQLIHDLVATKDAVPQEKVKGTTPSEEDIAAWNSLMQTPQRPEHSDMDIEDDLVLRQALQAQQDPDTFLQLTLAEIANANGPLTNTVLSQASAAHRGPGLVRPREDPPSLTPQRRPRLTAPMTPARPAGTAARGSGPQEGLMAVLKAQVVAYVENTNAAVRDPYQSSPHAGARIPSTSPIAKEPTFGPVRSKSRDANRPQPLGMPRPGLQPAGAGFQQEESTQTTTMTTVGAVSRRPIILDDDQDGAKEPGGSVANDLTTME